MYDKSPRTKPKHPETRPKRRSKPERLSVRYVREVCSMSIYHKKWG